MATNLEESKSCHFCSHQKVCSAFANFKIHVEPNLLKQNSTLKAANLAKICDMYLYENWQKIPSGKSSNTSSSLIDETTTTE